MPDELVTIYATGIAAAQEVSVAAGDFAVSPQSITAMPGVAGMYRITLRLPSGPAGGEMSISLEVKTSDGSIAKSNEVRIATETIPN